MSANYNTCRFCGTSQWEKAAPKSCLVRYGLRHWAHLACLHNRGRLDAVLSKLHVHQLNQLPALELSDLGALERVLELVREAAAGL